MPRSRLSILALSLLAACGRSSSDDSPPATLTATLSSRPEELLEEAEPGPALDGDARQLPIEEPELKDAEPDMRFPEEALEAPSDPSFHSDSPFAAKEFNDVLGIGGGAGGKFGGRFGGKKTLSASGSACMDGSSHESYAPVVAQGFRTAALEPLSTFSVDVDTAAYTNVRRFLLDGQQPPSDAVRIEELLNYFRYDDPRPEGAAPFAVRTEVASCPWRPQHRLLRIGLRARDVALAHLPPANLVFLIDVSGSMQPANKLPLLVKSLRLLVEHLNDHDRVAIVVYAGAAGLVLPSTPCTQRATIVAALERLAAGGSTAGAAGITLAYQVAREHLVAGGTNRVLLATDGDFNVGIRDRGELEALIRAEAASGVFLSVLGFGTGNLKDSTLETLADRGNGHYAYVDSLTEARRVLVAELGGTLVTVAKDVKLQVEFNPLAVQAWRLIGYENRQLAHSDFRDDTKDAGEIGAGHGVTALYEVVPVGVPFGAVATEPLRYQTPAYPTGAPAGELGLVKLRWKAPEATESVGSETIVHDGGGEWSTASDDFRFAASLAAFGLALRADEHRGDASLALAERLARAALGRDPLGTRAEHLRLLAAARGLER
ncbi:MAG TPA: VWA domain-containing protein [Planctomycetota bacterium]